MAKTQDEMRNVLLGGDSYLFGEAMRKAGISGANPPGSKSGFLERALKGRKSVDLGPVPKIPPPTEEE